MRLYESLDYTKIKQLKEDLMSEDITTINTSISNQITEIINTDKGIIFEDNVRNAFMTDLNWEPSKIPRKFFYREIYVNGHKYIITKNKSIILKGNNAKYDFCIDDETFSSEIYKNDSKKLFIKLIIGKEMLILP